MKGSRILRWALWLSVIVGVGIASAYGLKQLKAKRDAAAAAATAPSTVATLDLVPSDLVTVQTVTLQSSVPLSGSVRAVDTAWVKARAAGELQDLSAREGDRVQAGQVVARIDATDTLARLRQAEQQAQSAKVQIDIAQRQYDNNRALVDQGFISRTALDTSLSNLQAAQANHQAAVAAVDVVRKSLDDAVLRAPISGQVSQRAAQNGERVGIDARVLEIVDLRKLELEATVTAADAPQLRVGQSAQLRVEGVSQPITAKLVRISPSAQGASRAVTIYLSVASQAGLRQGLFAQGQIGTEQQSVAALPVAAVRVDQPQPYVQAFDAAAQRIEHMRVTLGVRGESPDAPGVQWVAVQGLAAGAQVLQGSVGTVRSGTPARLGKAADASAAPAGAAQTDGPKPPTAAR